MGKSVCVIGAGLSGLAAIRGLEAAGHEVCCYEAGAQVGGGWRYRLADGRSSAYRSLHTNVSRRNMRYGSLPIAGPARRRLHHSELLAYLERYAEINELADHIQFDSNVLSACPQSDGGWVVRVEGKPERRFDALTVATGCFSQPNVPRLAGEFCGQAMHVRDYRTPESFAGRRVVVVGAGQSALDVASEISLFAERTVLASRHAHHLMPERVLGVPVDYLDVALLNRAPWRLVRRLTQALLVSSPLAPSRGALPMPSFSILEHRWPVLVTPNIRRALAQDTFALKPGVESVDGEQVLFVDGTRERAEAIVWATGYRIDFPFLPDGLGEGDGMQFPLYRRILSPRAENLAFIGVLDVGPGRLLATETQVRWLGAVLAGHIRPPDPAVMWRAIDACGERRTRQRFGSSGAHTILCDRHAYVKTLERDLRRHL